MSIELWVDEYRSKTLEEYVFRDSHLRDKVNEWVEEGVLPHLMFSGPTGTGKTTLALLLIRLLGIPSGDFMMIPASKERKIDEITDKIDSFVRTWAIGDTGYKYILLDEADALSVMAQKVLRGEIENEGSLTRFIFTCNYPEKIMPPIRSRCMEFQLNTLDKDDFTVRVGEILVRENQEFDPEVLFDHVNATFPDLRKCINLIQQDCRGGKLHPQRNDEATSKDYVLEMANLFRLGRVMEGRKLLISQASTDEYPDIFRYFYRNLDLWGDTPYEQDEALLIIRRGLINHDIIADPEINLSAVLVELGRVRKV